MRLITVLFLTFVSSMTLAQSNGETGVLIRPPSLGEFSELLDLAEFPPIAICHDDYFLAFWLLGQHKNVYLEDPDEDFLIPIYMDEYTLRINDKQTLFPVRCVYH